ncbi:MFS transporter [Bacillus andreraoultii]|uniref:MFS transporter n=1 Tax=Bacillus andreraoultii TaxID=1499685 RepID=UPI00053B950B|nr:MFS transporter [Bacillus andreraoultii]
MENTANKVNAKHQAVEVSEKYWWKVVILFTIGWALMYADRTILNPVQAIIGDQFGLSNSQIGLINSVFFLTYAITQIPGGVIGDKYGRKMVVAAGFVLFGLTTGLTGLAGTFGIFMIWRALTGIGEGFYYGPQYALSTESIPTKNLTLGTAIINSGQALGISGGYLLSSKLVLQDGAHWSRPFYVMAIPTIIVGILFYVMLHEKVVRPEDKGKATTQAKSEGPKEKVSIGSIFKNRNLIFIFIMCFCSLYGFFVVTTWLPQFLQAERGYAGTEVGFISSLVPWASIPGAVIFARLSDKLKKSKLLIFILVPLAAISIVAVANVQSHTALIIALICYGLFGKLALDPIMVAFVTKHAPKVALSTALSAYNFIGMTSSILAPYLTGWFVDMIGSMQISFYISGVLLIVGLIFIVFTQENPTKQVK